jgi:hypothetical protein
MPKESIYNAKYTVRFNDGSIIKKTTGFIAYGRNSFEDTIRFMFQGCEVVFKKVWCEDPIDVNSPTYVEY